MDRHLKAHLYDINTAIDEVYSFFELVPKRFEEYQKNLMLRRAIERNIGIIGEATNKLLKENPEIGISHSKAIIATRNRVIHDSMQKPGCLAFYPAFRYLSKAEMAFPVEKCRYSPHGKGE